MPVWHFALCGNALEMHLCAMRENTYQEAN